MGKQILVVDDSESIREVVSFTLENEGYDVKVGNDGTDALKFLDGSPIDLVITDLKMPRKDGISLIEHISENYPGLKTLIITSYSNSNLAEIGIDKGAHSFLLKPLDFDQLLQRLSKIFKEEKAN